MSEQGAPADPGPSPVEEAAAPPSNSPWNLEDHPEELRPFLETELKKIEGGVTKRFQEAAEFRKRMEPLSALADVEGINDVPPEEIGQLLEFRNLVSDPDRFAEWWQNVGEELGLFEAGEDTPDGGQGQASDDPPAWAQTMLETNQQLQQRLEQLETQHEQQQRQQIEMGALEQIQASLDELHEQHGDFDEDAVLELSMAYDDADAVKKGFARYQEITGKAQSELVADKEGTRTSTPVSGGQADTAPEPVNGFANAKDLARQRLTASR